MDPLRSFSDYDLLAHVPQGFLAFAATDYVFGSSIVLGRSDWNAGYIILVLIMSYIIGHLIAGPSHFVLEKILARKLMGGSSMNLLSHTRRKNLLRWVFPEYFEPAGYPVRTGVLARLAIAEVTRDRVESAFWSAYGVARCNEYARARMRTFLNLYGFCRNSAFLALITSLTLVARNVVLSSPADFWSFGQLAPALGLFLVSILMCQRYFKFYRLYALEVFVGFLAQPTPPDHLDNRKA